MVEAQGKQCMQMIVNGLNIVIFPKGEMKNLVPVSGKGTRGQQGKEKKDKAIFGSKNRCDWRKKTVQKMQGEQISLTEVELKRQFFEAMQTLDKVQNFTRKLSHRFSVEQGEKRKCLFAFTLFRPVHHVYSPSSSLLQQLHIKSI